MMRLGICVPNRPRPGDPGFDEPASWGCLRDEIHAPLMEKLRQDTRITALVERDFRRAVIRSGALLVDGVPLHEGLDGYFWYAEIDRLPGTFHLEALKTLARQVPVYPDPWRWEVAVDKYRAHLTLLDAGVTVPEFLLVDVASLPLSELVEQLAPTLEEWGAAVLKPRRGAWGKGVMIVEDITSLRDLIGYIRATSGTSPDGGFFLERYYENAPEDWVSATMLDGRVVYGYRKRESKRAVLGKGRYKILDADERGGEVDLAMPSGAHEAMARMASEALGCPIIGFDMIATSKGPMIVDENTSPGNYLELYEEVGLDPAEVFCEMIISQTTRRGGE